MAPEQPWEALETIHDFKPKPSQPRIWKWIALSSFALGMVAVLVVFGLFLRGGLLPSQPTSVSTSLQPTDPTPIFTLTTPSDIQPAQPLPPVEQPTIKPQEGSTGTIVICPIRVRTYPSVTSDDSPNLRNLRCGQTVILSGVFINLENNREWYRIDYTDDDGNQSGWVFANSVKVPQEIKDKLPLLDNSGTPISSEPLPTIFTDCIYTVQSGDTLSKIEQEFGIAGDSNRKITQCVLDIPECDLQNNPSLIKAGWRVIVPDVTDIICKERGGEVYSE